MLNLNKLLIDGFIDNLNESYTSAYSYINPEYREIVAWVAQLALENIANSDAMYHDMEHTIMVTLAGKEIINGKHILKGGVTPKDWLHYMLALLCHDIGIVRGICRDDGHGTFTTGNNGEILEFPESKTDAFLAPYHVDRSKLFVRERFGNNTLAEIDADRVCRYIEMTRYPSPHTNSLEENGLGGLVRAADFIGQLGDPNYLKKIPALYFEFTETGLNEDTGYSDPGDMRNRYAKFYWQVVNPFLNEAIKYLNVTYEGRQWVANLQSNVFDVEHHNYKMGDIPDFYD